MNKMKMIAGLALSFLLLIPLVSEGKRKNASNDRELTDDTSRSKHNFVRETLDLSGYGVIDEVKRLNLQSELQRMILQHNQRQATRRSKVRNVQYRNSSSLDRKDGRIRLEDINYLDLGSYDLIDEAEQQKLAERLNKMIELHNLHVRGKLKSGSLRRKR